MVPQRESMGTRFGTFALPSFFLFPTTHPYYLCFFLNSPRANVEKRGWCEKNGDTCQKSLWQFADHYTPHPASWRTCFVKKNLRLRCCKGISTLASVLRVTRVRCVTLAKPCLWSPYRPVLTRLLPLLIFLSIRLGRRRHGVLYKYPQSARRTIHDLCVILFPPNLFLLNPHLTHTVRFKIIADDGRIVLMPRESLAAHDMHVTL